MPASPRASPAPRSTDRDLDTGTTVSSESLAHSDRADPFEPDASEEHALNPTEMPQERLEAIAHQQRPNALIIHETIRLEGVEELKRDVPSLLLSGFAAGLSMSFSLVCQGVLQAALPDTPWRHLITSLGYTIGFLIVVIGRQQLFTENTLTPMLSLLHKRDLATLLRVARLWTLVICANIGATWLVAYVLFKTDIFEPIIKDAFLDISYHTVGSSFGTTFVKGIFAGWLIALMVWLLPAAEAARVFVVIIITYVVSVSNFAHIIAGSVDAAYLVYAGEASFADYVVRFFFPTFLGNVLGGVGLVAILNFGQVAPLILSE